MEPRGASPGLPAWPPSCSSVLLAPQHGPAQRHTWCHSPKAGKGQWKLRGNSPVSSSLSVPALPACGILSGAELGLALPEEPNRATFLQLHSAKAENSPGCTGAVSQPCCSLSLFLSHGSPGYSVSSFCHTTDLPKAPEQVWGTRAALEQSNG